MDTPSIYVACLASCNNATLHGISITAPEPDAEEYALHDYEGFCGIKIHEYESICNIVEYASFIKEHGELGLALLCNYSMDGAQTMLEDNYQ